jgi:hypothetical protein
MAMDNERNRVLAALREHVEGADSAVLSERLSLPKEIVERHLLYCGDYDLAKWRRARNGLGQAMITDRGRDYLARQSL